MGKISKKVIMRRKYEMKKHDQNYKFSKEYQDKLLRARNYHQQSYKPIECQSKREKELSRKRWKKQKEKRNSKDNSFIELKFPTKSFQKIAGIRQLKITLMKQIR